MKCFICKQEIDKFNGRHIYFCAKNNNINISNYELRFRQLCYAHDFIFTKDYISQKYLIDRWSLPDFKIYHNLQYKQTQFLLDYFGIKRRGIIEASDTKRHEKYIKTCESKYGCKNVSQNKNIKEKKKKTFMLNYGVDNIFKDKNFIDSINNIMLNKYGKLRLTNPKKISLSRKKWWASLKDEDKNKFIKMYIDNFRYGPVSKLEKRVCDVLYKWNTSFQTQYRLGKYICDFLFGKNIIIEVQGDFWHGNPELYKSGDKLAFPNHIVIVDDIWEKDFKKKKYIENAGYKIIYLWERDIIKMNDEQISSYLEKELWKLN
jgi:very-short-patch-repair endonuclease